MKNPINYRSLIKQVYRYTRPRSYRHSEKIWPYISIHRDADGWVLNGTAHHVLDGDRAEKLRAYAS